MKPKLTIEAARDMTARALQDMTPGTAAVRFIHEWTTTLLDTFDISESAVEHATGEAWEAFKAYHAPKANAAAELSALTKAANEAYLAIYAATLHAPQKPEFDRLKSVNNNLRLAIVRANQA